MKSWLAEAIDRCGGIREVAARAELSVTHVGNLYHDRRPLTVDSVNALEPELDVPSETWQAALRSRPRRKRARAEIHTPAAPHECAEAGQ